MKRLFESFRSALNGILLGVSGQQNMKIHVTIAIMVVVVGFYFHISGGEWLAIVLCIGLVLSTELLNTALEHLVNLVSPHHQALAGKIKDVAAGAVLVLAIASSIVGLIIFSKYL